MPKEIPSTRDQEKLLEKPGTTLPLPKFPEGGPQLPVELFDQADLNKTDQSIVEAEDYSLSIKMNPLHARPKLEREKRDS